VARVNKQLSGNVSRPLFDAMFETLEHCAGVFLPNQKNCTGMKVKLEVVLANEMFSPQVTIMHLFRLLNLNINRFYKTPDYYYRKQNGVEPPLAMTVFLRIIKTGPQGNIQTSCGTEKWLRSAPGAEMVGILL